MDPSQKLELLNWYLVVRNTQFLFEFPNRSPLNSEGRRFEVGSCFTWNSEGMRAAGVGPHVWEGDLFRGALLEEEFAVWAAWAAWGEEKYGEGTV